MNEQHILLTNKEADKWDQQKGCEKILKSTQNITVVISYQCGNLLKSKQNVAAVFSYHFSFLQLKFCLHVSYSFSLVVSLM